MAKMKHVEVYLSPGLRETDRNKDVAELYQALEEAAVSTSITPQSSRDCDYVFPLDDGIADRAVEKINQRRGLCAKVVDP